jgi:hypothetical protein
MGSEVLKRIFFMIPPQNVSSPLLRWLSSVKNESFAVSSHENSKPMCFYWLVESAAPSLAPVRLLNLCHRLSTIEDVEKLIESCNIER